MIPLIECTKINDIQKYGLTIDDIQKKLNLDRTTILRRKGFKNIHTKSLPNPSGKGRRINVYDIRQVCRLFQIELPSHEEIEAMQKERKSSDDFRADKGKPRKPEEWTQDQRDKLEAWMKEKTKALYMQNQSKESVRFSTETAASLYILEFGLPSYWNNKVDFCHYIYHQRIKRNDVHYEGWYKKEKWADLWETANRNSLSKIGEAVTRYDYFSMFAEANYIKENYGAGKMWMMDGTAFDGYVKVDDNSKKGKIVRPSFFVVACGLTAKVLTITPIRSESARTVIMVMEETYRKIGSPLFGIPVDNSSAFKSREVREHAKTYLTDEQIEVGKKIMGNFGFDSEHFPLLYPKAGQPKSPFKGKIERLIGTINKLIASMSLTKNVFQRNRFDMIDKNDQRSFFKILKEESPNALEAFEQLVETVEIYQRTIDSTTYKQLLNVAISKGWNTSNLGRNLDSMFAYLGGYDKSTYIERPKSKEPLALYSAALCDTSMLHRVRCLGIGVVMIKHRKLEYNYISPKLEFDYLNEIITVVPDWQDSNKAYLFLEASENPVCDKFAKNETVIYIGESEDCTVKKFSDLGKVQKVKSVRDAGNKVKADKLANIEEIDFSKSLKEADKDVEIRMLDNTMPSIRLPLGKNHTEFVDTADDIHDNEIIPFDNINEEDYEVIDEEEIIKEEEENNKPNERPFKDLSIKDLGDL